MHVRVSVFDSPEFDDHEMVSFITDAATGLRCIIAVHWGGPIGTAGGGCRMIPYASDDEALRDVLRLSRAMSYKLALADLPGGGAKSVILGDPRRDKTRELLHAFGRAVDRLGGRYIVGEDVGTTPADMQTIAEETDYVVGRSSDTAAATALGVFVGLRAAVRRRLGHRDLADIHVAIQGLGGVGMRLAEALHKAGTRLTVTDSNEEAVADAVRRFGAAVVSPAAIYDVEADVFAPCALGSVLNDETIPRLRVAVVAGGANNPLAQDRHADALLAREILYAPDFVLNAGGVIAAAAEVDRWETDTALPVEEDEAMRRRIDGIDGRLNNIFEHAADQRISPHTAAMKLAQARIARARE